MISVYWRDHELYQHEVFRKASGPPMLQRYVNTQRERKQNSLLSFLFAKRHQYTNWRGDTRLWPLDHQRSSFLFESSKTILPFNNNFGFCIFYKLNMFCIFCIVCIFCIFCISCMSCIFCILCIFCISIQVSKGQFIQFSTRLWHQVSTRSWLS